MRKESLSKERKENKMFVCVRIRPLGGSSTVNEDNEEIGDWIVKENCIMNKESKNMFAFDKIFNSKQSNSIVFDNMGSHLIEKTMNGMNSTAFTYGQTSSGKTFTMFGNENNFGLIQMSLTKIFHFIANCKDKNFSIKISFIEIYNENIRDLLSTQHKQILVKENLKEIYLSNVNECNVNSIEQSYDLLQKGMKNVSIGETNINDKSSRSHSLFKINIESTPKNSTHPRLISCLNLVDLAGSERLSSTGAEGLRLKEGTHINKSLLTLGTVISKLSDGNNDHIPYRDSKLTRILQNSLGGNACTAIICTIHPAYAYRDETISTLKFASRAKNVVIRPVINEIISDQDLIKKYQHEIVELKKQLINKENTSKSLPSRIPSFSENSLKRASDIFDVDENHKKPKLDALSSHSMLSEDDDEITLSIPVNNDTQTESNVSVNQVATSPMTPAVKNEQFTVPMTPINKTGLSVSTSAMTPAKKNLAEIGTVPATPNVNHQECQPMTPCCVDQGCDASIISLVEQGCEPMTTSVLDQETATTVYSYVEQGCSPITVKVSEQSTETLVSIMNEQGSTPMTPKGFVTREIAAMTPLLQISHSTDPPTPSLETKLIGTMTPARLVERGMDPLSPLNQRIECATNPMTPITRPPSMFTPAHKSSVAIHEFLNQEQISQKLLLAQEVQNIRIALQEEYASVESELSKAQSNLNVKDEEVSHLQSLLSSTQTALNNLQEQYTVEISSLRSRITSLSAESQSADTIKAEFEALLEFTNQQSDRKYEELKAAFDMMEDEKVNEALELETRNQELLMKIEELEMIEIGDGQAETRLEEAESKFREQLELIELEYKAQAEIQEEQSKLDVEAAVRQKEEMVGEMVVQMEVFRKELEQKNASCEELKRMIAVTSEKEIEIESLLVRIVDIEEKARSDIESSALEGEKRLQEALKVRNSQWEEHLSLLKDDLNSKLDLKEQALSGIEFEWKAKVKILEGEYLREKDEMKVDFAQQKDLELKQLRINIENETKSAIENLEQRLTDKSKAIMNLQEAMENLKEEMCDKVDNVRFEMMNEKDVELKAIKTKHKNEMSVLEKEMTMELERVKTTASSDTKGQVTELQDLVNRMHDEKVKIALELEQLQVSMKQKEIDFENNLQMKQKEKDASISKALEEKEIEFVDRMRVIEEKFEEKILALTTNSKQKEAELSDYWTQKAKLALEEMNILRERVKEEEVLKGELISKLETLTNDRNRFEDDLESETLQIKEHYEQRIKKLMEEGKAIIASLDDKLQDSHEEYKKQLDTISSELEQARAFQSASLELQKENSLLKQDHEALETKIKSFEDQFYELRADYDGILTQTLKDHEEEVEEMREEYEAKIAAAKQSANDAEGFRFRLDKMKREYEDKMEEMRKAHNHQLFQKKHTNNEQVVDELQKQIHDLKVKKDLKKEIIKDLTHQVNELKKQLELVENQPKSQASSKQTTPIASASSVEKVPISEMKNEENVLPKPSVSAIEEEKENKDRKLRRQRMLQKSTEGTGECAQQ